MFTHLEISCSFNFPSIGPKENIFLSILFSFIIIFGSIVNELKYNAEVSIFRTFFTFRNFIYIVGIFNLLYIVFTNVMPKLYLYSIKNEKNALETLGI